MRPSPRPPPPPCVIVAVVVAVVVACLPCSPADGQQAGGADWTPRPVAGPETCALPSRCVRLPACPSALQALREDKRRRPQVCGFDGRVPVVCCAPTQQGDRQGGQRKPASSSCPSSGQQQQQQQQPADETPAPVVVCDQLAQHYGDDGLATDSAPGKVARRMCRKHQEDVCALPKNNPAAVCPANGEYADILEFPHMALLGYGDRDSLTYACGGSLVSESYILTAAHCASLSGQPVRWALLGATNRTSQQPKFNDTHQLIEVTEVIVHPEYVASAKYHDVALLRLATKVAMSKMDVRPACLDTDVDEDYTGRDAVATGWGATNFGEDGSESLIKVNLTVRTLQYCRDNIELSASKLPRGLENTQLCAGGGAHGRDTCQGDSGGPLQVRANPTNSETCIFRLLGIVSFGPPCGLGKPAVYTRVAAYVEWIESVLWPVRSDGCARVLPESGEELLVPYSGPGTVARGMCRVYHVDYCAQYFAGITHVKPDLSLSTVCHHNRPKSDWRYQKSPTSVTLRYGSNLYDRQHACAGALVSPRAVLTAARCRALGCLPLSAASVDDPLSCTGDLVFPVESVVVHPQYRAGEAYADLAVATLSQSVDLRIFLPLCLDTRGDLAKPGARAKAAGWNVQGFWEHISYNLANTSVTVHGTEQCSAALLGNERVREALPKGVPPALLLCAGGLCHGDEAYAGERGVPLTLRSHTLRTEQHGDLLVDSALGIASSLSHCDERTKDGAARLPDVYTAVAGHVAWVERVVWPDEKA